MSLREGRLALLAGILLHALFVGSLFGQYLNPLFYEAEHSFGQAGDYYGIYTAGEDLVHGRSIYSGFEDHSGAIRRVPYFYFFRYLPPTAYVSALTTLVLSPRAGYLLWVVLTEIMLVWIVRSILRLESQPMPQRRIHAALWLGFFPFYLEQWMGQFSFLMALFLWIMLRPVWAGTAGPPPPARRVSPDGAGTLATAGPGGGSASGASSDPDSGYAARGPVFFAWTGSVILKSFTGLLAISLIRRRQFRPVILCAGVLLLACAPYWLAHPSDIRQFLVLNFRPLPPNIHGGTLGGSALVRLLGWTMPAEIAGKRLVLGAHDVFVGNLPVLGVSAIVLALALWAVVRRGDRTPIQLQLALWVLCFFLIFKDIWEYHYVMLLPVVTALALAYRSRFVVWMGVLLAAPTPYILLAGPDGTVPGAWNLVHHASKAIPTFALFLWTYRRCVREGGGPPPLQVRDERP